MTPWLSDPDVTLYHGDVLSTLREMSAESVDCVVTSPPYWGLRDYGAEGQLGLELTPEQYVERMVEVFREVRRVLAPHGTVWLNLGDSYASQGGPQVPQTKQHVGSGLHGTNRNMPDLKPKDLVGVPWRVAFALQADGWYLRSDIIWAKPNPMPESVTDRPTKAHEYVFLLSKQPRYFFDQEAVREAWVGDAQNGKFTRKRNSGGRNDGYTVASGTVGSIEQGRNIRSVWEIATQPFSGNALGGGTSYRASPDCPRHGLRAALRRWQRAADGEPPDQSSYRIDSTDARLALERHGALEATTSRSPESPASNDERMLGSTRGSRRLDPSLSVDSQGGDEFVPDRTTRTESSHATLADSSDSPGLFDASTATLRNTGSHRMAELSDEGGTGDGETLVHTQYTPPSHGSPERDGSDSHGLSETPADTSRTCTCTRIVLDHFATFPEELARRCISAGCPENGVVLDPFVGSGTVCFVARKLNRRSVGIDLSAEYLELAARRLQQQSLFAVQT